MPLCRCSSNNPLWMMVIFGGIAAASLSGTNHGELSGEPEGATTSATDAETNDPAFVLGYALPRIDGEPQDLHEYKGQVVLIVNVASKCGLTPQYEALEKLYRQHRDEGFVILGFPANDFGKQEPGSNAEILEFCTSRFDVSFPMFEKISVVGKTAHPLYQRLRELEIEEIGGKPGQLGGDPGWNFTKFLVDRSGRVDSRYSPRVTPDDERLTDRIAELLDTEG